MSSNNSSKNKCMQTIRLQTIHIKTVFGLNNTRVDIQKTLANCIRWISIPVVTRGVQWILRINLEYQS